MAELIIRTDDGDEVTLNPDVSADVIARLRSWQAVIGDNPNTLTNERSWWTIDDYGYSNSSDSYTYLVGRVFDLLSGGCGSVISKSWRRSTAGIIVAQLAHVHGMAPLIPRDEERAAR